MAKQLDVSLKEVRAYEAQINCFRDNLEYECAALLRAFQKVNETLDRETSEAFWPCIDSIQKTVAESKKVLDQLEARVRKCAIVVEKMERSTTLREEQLLKKEETLQDSCEQKE